MPVFERSLWRRDAGGVTSTRIDPDLETEDPAEPDDTSSREMPAMPSPEGRPWH